MKAVFRWFAKILGSVLALILLVVLFPYVSRLANRILPDIDGAAIRTSAVLAQKLEHSARLETLSVELDGSMSNDYTISLIGTVAQLSATYKYEGSFGIDLKQVTIRVSGDEIIFTLPQPVLIQDTLTFSNVHKNDFWIAGGITPEMIEELREAELVACREKYLSGEYSEALWLATEEAFQDTVADWMREIDANVKLTCQRVQP